MKRIARPWLLVGLGASLLACDDSSAISADHDDYEEHDDDEVELGPLDAPMPDAGPVSWGEPIPLVEAEAWRPAAAADDALLHERPLTIDCPSAAWGPELGGLEIQTGVCNYFSAVQGSLAAIEPGDAIEIVVLHAELDASEPAEGHVAVALGDAVVWEQRVSIPARAEVIEATVIADRAWLAGTPVGLHLHNHGYNAWTVLSLDVAAAR